MWWGGCDPLLEMETIIIIIIMHARFCAMSYLGVLKYFSFHEKYHFFLPYSLTRTCWVLVICQAKCPWWTPSLLAIHNSLEFMIRMRQSQARRQPGSPALKSIDPIKAVHLLLLHQPPPLSVPRDPTGFSGYRFTTSRQGRNWNLVCHPTINLMLIWLRLVQRRLCYPGSEPGP